MSVSFLSVTTREVKVSQLEDTLFLYLIHNFRPYLFRDYQKALTTISATFPYMDTKVQRLLARVRVIYQMDGEKNAGSFKTLPQVTPATEDMIQRELVIMKRELEEKSQESQLDMKRHGVQPNKSVIR